MPQFHEIFATRQPIKAVTFPAWKTKEEWDAFLAGLFKKWDGKWEKHR